MSWAGARMSMCPGCPLVFAHTCPRTDSAPRKGRPGTHRWLRAVHGRLKRGDGPVRTLHSHCVPLQLKQAAPPRQAGQPPTCPPPALPRPPPSPASQRGALAIFEGTGLHPHGVRGRKPALREGLGSAQAQPLPLSPPGSEGHTLTDLEAQARQLLAVGQRDGAGHPVHGHLRGVEGLRAGGPSGWDWARLGRPGVGVVGRRRAWGGVGGGRRG